MKPKDKLLLIITVLLTFAFAALAIYDGLLGG